GDLLQRRLAPLTRLESRVSLHYGPIALDHALREPHEPALVGQGMGDCAADAPARVGRERGATLGIEAVDRVEQPDRAFLDEIVEREAEVAIAERDALHESDVQLDDPLPGPSVAGACGPQEPPLVEPVRRPARPLPRPLVG